MGVRAKTMYEAESDGQLFPDIEEARAHDRFMKRKKKLATIFQKLNIQSNIALVDLMNKPVVATELRDILNDILTYHRDNKKRATIAVASLLRAK